TARITRAPLSLPQAADAARTPTLPKNFCLDVKFTLQEKESAYKLKRDNPNAERFVKTGPLLLFLETA
ncbi:MAG: hypothetical protein KGL10_06585, partial [Alphaproteobacteria bacterium]|nr:hypothetical protein [Alphaproteobacteria bacterium]